MLAVEIASALLQEKSLFVARPAPPASGLPPLLTASGAAVPAPVDVEGASPVEGQPAVSEEGQPPADAKDKDSKDSKEAKKKSNRKSGAGVEVAAEEPRLTWSNQAKNLLLILLSRCNDKVRHSAHNASI
jgi:hypothetical protein